MFFLKIYIKKIDIFGLFALLKNINNKMIKNVIYDIDDGIYCSFLLSNNKNNFFHFFEEDFHF